MPRFLASARGGRPRATHAIGRKVELGYQGQTYSLTVGQIGPHSYRVGRRQRRTCRRGRTARRIREPTDPRRPAFPHRHGRGPHWVPRRGGRHQSPHQPGRGRPGPRRGSGRGGRHAGGRGRPGRGRRHPGGPGEHEDGNRPARTGRGPGSGDLRRGQQPGRCGCGAAALRPGR